MNTLTFILLLATAIGNFIPIVILICDKRRIKKQWKLEYEISQQNFAKWKLEFDKKLKEE